MRDHFSSTLFYHHQLELYESMIDYLKTIAGPAGCNPTKLQLISHFLGK